MFHNWKKVHLRIYYNIDIFRYFFLQVVNVAECPPATCIVYCVKYIWFLKLVKH